MELIQGKMLQYLKYEHDFVNLSYFSKEHLKENMAFRSTCKEEAEKKRQTKANATLSKQSADEIINIKACISAFWKGYMYGQDIPLSVEYGATMEKENNILSKMYSVMQHQTGYDAWLFQSGHWDLRDISVDLYMDHLELFFKLLAAFRDRHPDVVMVWSGVPPYSYQRARGAPGSQDSRSADKERCESINLSNHQNFINVAIDFIAELDQWYRVVSSTVSFTVSVTVSSFQSISTSVFVYPQYLYTVLHNLCDVMW